jgi:hypothetical protein
MIPAAVRCRPALSGALVVFVVGVLALGLTQRTTPLPLARGRAIQAVEHSPLAARILAGSRFTSVSVTPLDSDLDRVSFFDHGQIVAQAAVRRDGVVTHGEGFSARSVPYGDWIAYQPAVLIGLAALFALMAGVAPWCRLRNLDVVAALSLVAPVVLLQKRYVDASVVTAAPGLGYLMVRCALRGLGPAPARSPSRPLLDLLTPGWDARRRVRLLRLMLMTLALIFVMVTVSSREAVDVTYAVMEGATKLLGGVLPYGHMPGDVIHGDTYPLLSYALYTPLAWVSPVQSTWSSVDVALGATATAALAVAWALFRAVAGARPGRRGSRPAELELAGLRTATCWLSFPPLLAAASTGTSDVVLAAMLVFALVLWRRPGWATGLLAVGAWFKLVPLVLLPTRLAPLRGRRLTGALLVIALVSVPMIALLVALGGLDGPFSMIRAMSYQLSRGSPQAVWDALGIEGLQPVGQAATLALVAGATIRLATRPSWEQDTARMAALAGAILIALQLAANYWAFLYLAWAIPPVALSLWSEPAVESRVPEPARRRIAAPQSGLVGAR